MLLGESAVGKSSIVLRYMKDEFLTSVDPTIGVACVTLVAHVCTLLWPVLIPARVQTTCRRYSTKSTRLRDGTYIPFEIWDTAGQVCAVACVQRVVHGLTRKAPAGALP